MAIPSFTPPPSDDEARAIGETLIFQNINLRKSLFDQISENDRLRTELAAQRGILEDLAHAARAHAMSETIISMPLAHALADALAYLKEVQS